MSSIESGVAWFWRRVEGATAPIEEGLGVLRILAGLFLFFFSAPYSTWVNGAPPAFYNPPLLSLGRLLPTLPPPIFMWALDVTLLGLCALVTMGVRARPCTLALCLLSLLRCNIVYSFGKIDHDILIMVFFGCMTWSGWGKTLAVLPDAPSRFDRPRHAFAILGVCLTYAMTSVGFQKGLNWLDFNLETSGFLGWFVHGYFEYGRTHLLAPYVLDLPRIILELIDYAAVAFEVGCVVALLAGRVVFRVWLCVACAFHLINTLTLNIPFFENLLVYLAFVDFSCVARWLLAGDRPARRWAAMVAIPCLPALHVGLRLAGGGSSFLFVVDKLRDQPTLLYVSAVSWTVALGVACMSLRLEYRRHSAGLAEDLAVLKRGP